MEQCSTVGCLSRPQFEVLRMSTPLMAPASKLTDRLCVSCIDQSKRLGDPLRVMRTLLPHETGQTLVGE